VAPGTWGRAQLFLTHLHSDHTADAVQLLSLGPMLGGRQAEPLHVWGPSGPSKATGTAAFVDGLNAMLAWDRVARQRVQQVGAAAGLGGRCDGGAAGQQQTNYAEDEGEECSDRSKDGAAAAAAAASVQSINIAEAHEFDHSVAKQLVYERDGVRIYSTPVDHYFMGGPVAYRLEWEGLSVVISGDTAPVETLTELAQGADVFVLDALASAPAASLSASGSGKTAGLSNHENAAEGATPSAGTTPQERRNIVASHMTPAQAGTAFAAAASRLGACAGSWSLFLFDWGRGRGGG